MAFDRVVELYVGNFAHGNNPETKGVLVSDLDMEFHVERSVVWFENKAVFRLYNASQSTRNQVLSGGNSVVFRAGYADEVVGTIWIGQIGYSWTEPKGTDNVTTLICTSGRGGQYPLARVKVSMAFSKGVEISRVLEDLAAYAGLSVNGIRNVGDIYLDERLVLIGDLRTALRYIYKTVLEQYGASLYVDNNELMVFRSYGDKSELESAYLSYSTGLISATPYRDEGKNEINYRQDLAYWSGFSEKFDSVDAAEIALKKANEDYAKATNESKVSAAKAVADAKANLVKQQERVQVIKATGREPEKAEEISRRNSIKFKAMLNPLIVPNTLVDINTEEKDSPDQVKGIYHVEKSVFDGDNMGGDFHILGDAFS